METHECPACGMRFRHPAPNACTACGRVHCRNCLAVFRDEVEEEAEGRFLLVCPDCAGALDWRIEAQEVAPSTWADHDGRAS